MLVVFFDSQGVIHYEFVPHGQTVNKEFLCSNSEMFEGNRMLEEASVVDETQIIMRHLGKKFGVMKPTMWIIHHGCNSS
jgi:hypothetical protein